MRPGVIALTFALAACGGSRRQDAPAAAAALLAPEAVGMIAVLNVELPEGGVIGGHFDGVQFQRRVSDLTMTEGLRRALMQRARFAADTVLQQHGYAVRSSGAPTSDASRLDGVRFALTASVGDVRVRSEGSTPPLRVQASADVTWELIDLAAGAPVFGTRQSAFGRTDDSIEIAIVQAIGRSLAQLLADSAFRAALSAPRPAGLERLHGFESGRRDRIEPDQFLVLRPEDRNQSSSPHPVDRVAAGTVALSNRRDMVSAFLISRDGLALSVSWIGRRHARLTARFPNGVERPARLLRERGSFALFEVSCPDPCQTVDLVDEDWTSERDSLFTLGAPWRTGESWFISRGEGGGRCGLFGGRSRSLGLDDNIEVRGQPVARPDGRVFAIGLQAGREACAVSLREVLRELRIEIQREEAR